MMMYAYIDEIRLVGSGNFHIENLQVDCKGRATYARSTSYFVICEGLTCPSLGFCGQQILKDSEFARTKLLTIARLTCIWNDLCFVVLCSMFVRGDGPHRKI